MNTQQINNLKKIMTSIDSDYKLSQLHYERQVELIEAIKHHQLQKPFYELEHKGRRWFKSPDDGLRYYKP